MSETERPTDGTESVCQHCTRPIVWRYDQQPDGTLSDEHGFWCDRQGATEVCFGTEYGWHRPLGATEDNGWPTVAQRRIAAALAEVNLLGWINEGCLDDLAGEHPWFVFEKSTHNGDIFVQEVDSPEEASRVIAGQEYPEDWATQCLLNVDTGERFYPEVHIVWHAFPA